MTLPFTVEQFFEVFARYNERVWPIQLVLNGLAIAVVAALGFDDRRSGRAIGVALASLWGWMAIAYHFAFFSAINPAAWLFGAAFLLGASVFAWAALRTEPLRFARRGGMRGWAGGLLIVLALLLYPLLGYLLGHRYPAVPTFGLPCPTTIFTLGILVFAAGPLRRAVFVVPLLWAVVGSIAAFQLGMPQDFGLLVAGLVGFLAAIIPPVPSGAVREVVSPR